MIAAKKEYVACNREKRLHC